MERSTIIGLAFGAIVLSVAAIVIMTSIDSDLSLQAVALEDRFRVSHRGVILFDREEFVIMFSDIKEVELVESLASVRRIRGTNTPRVAIGRYRSEHLGEFRAYVLRQQGPHLFIRTVQEAYLLTPEDAVGLYTKLADR